MNGDLKTIYDEVKHISDELIAIKALQKERHKANISRMDKIDNLQCGVHAERMNGFNIAIRVLFGAVVGLTGWIITIHFTP